MTDPRPVPRWGTVTIRVVAGMLALCYWILIAISVYNYWALARGGWLGLLLFGYLVFQAGLCSAAAISARIMTASVLLAISTLFVAAIAMTAASILNDASHSPISWQHRAAGDLVVIGVIFSVSGIIFVALAVLTRVVPAPVRISRPARPRLDRVV